MECKLIAEFLQLNFSVTSIFLKDVQKTKNSFVKNILLFIAILLTTLVIVNLCWWLKIATSTEGFENAVETYLNVFPDFMQSPTFITLLNLLFTALPIGICIYLINIRFQIVMSIIVFILSTVAFAWNLWTMM